MSSTILRDYNDAMAEKYLVVEQVYGATFDRMLAALLGRKPWAWASLPGLPYRPGTTRIEIGTLDHATGRVYRTTSVRVDGGPEAFRLFDGVGIWSEP